MARQNPVIPEIAKAYENDPRTLLALAAMKSGQATTPVAQGNYGYGDGIARVAQALMGGYIENKQRDKYGKDEADMLAKVQAQGKAGLGTLPGAPAPPAAPAAPMPAAGAVDPNGQPMDAPPPQMAAAAAALGAPAPVPAQGGGPGGQSPFGSSSGGLAAGSPVPVPATAPLKAPVPGIVPATVQPISDAPPPVARPVAPAPVGATRSRLLDEAYNTMANASRYDVERARNMLTSGLSDQTKLDESAAERKQRLADMGYQTDLGMFSSAGQQDRAHAYTDIEDAKRNNFTDEERTKTETFTAGQNDLTRQNERALEAMRASSALAVARIRGQDGLGGGTNLTEEERAALSKAVGDGRIDLKGITRFQAKVAAQALVDNPDLDAIHLHAVANLAANATAQKQSMMIEVAPAIVKSMQDAGKKVNFSDAQFMGKLQAWGKGQLNDPDFINYMSKRADVVQTLAQIMRGTGATDKAVALETDAAPKTMSPKAFDAWASAQFDQLEPRLDVAVRRRLITEEDAGNVRRAIAATKSNAAPAKGGVYSDPDKEARYQAWLKANAH